MKLKKTKVEGEQTITRHKNDGYLDGIQERMDGDVFRAMLEVMAQRVMEEELALHLGAERHERAQERRATVTATNPEASKRAWASSR